MEMSGRECSVTKNIKAGVTGQVRSLVCKLLGTQVTENLCMTFQVSQQIK